MRNAFILLALALLLSPAVQADLEWAYPKFDPKHPPSPIDKDAPRTIPGSDKTYTLHEVDDDLNPPDWFPDDHMPQPKIVRNTEDPVKACTACHMASGMGHPQSSPVVGLPVEYFIQQIKDFKDGKRIDSSGWMNKFSGAISEEDARLAAEYFASMEPVEGWFKVIETDTVPKSHIGESRLRLRNYDGGEEPLGQRIVELAQDEDFAISKHPYSGFEIYVPVGSVEAGKKLVTTGGGKTLPCLACHGVDLKGMGNIPGIAGMDAIYLVRQLNDFKTGNRNTPLGMQMTPVVQNLDEDDMIAIAAYLVGLGK